MPVANVKPTEEISSTPRYILAAMITPGLKNTLRRSALVALLLFSLAIAGCGSSSSSTSESSTADTGATAAESTNASADGAKIFTDNCASCHTLKAAGSKGAVGPDLDKTKPDEALVNDRVTNGKGAMPALKESLSADEIDAVSDYVATSAGS